MDVIVDHDTNLKFYSTDAITVDGIPSERNPEFCTNSIIEFRYDGEADPYPGGAAFRYVADVEIDEETWLKDGVLQTREGTPINKIRLARDMYTEW